MKFLVILCLIMLLAVPCFAASNHNNSQLQAQQQGQLQGQAQGQAQAAVAAQGQIANGDVSVAGDETKVKSYAVAYPSLSGGEGISQANAYSIFGGLGLSNTEKYKTYITQIQAIEASQILSADQKKVMVDELATKMLKSNKAQRWLGIGFETSGRNLINLFGILSWDSFWADGQKPFQRSKDIGK